MIFINFLRKILEKHSYLMMIEAFILEKTFPTLIK